MSKKILAALLAVMMVLTMVPMTAFAADEPAAYDAAEAVIGTGTNDAEAQAAGEPVDGKLIVNVTLTSDTPLECFQNNERDNEYAYWAGFYIKAPEGATQSTMSGGYNEGGSPASTSTEANKGENNDLADIWIQASWFNGGNKRCYDLTWKNGEGETVEVADGVTSVTYVVDGSALKLEDQAVEPAILQNTKDPALTTDQLINDDYATSITGPDNDGIYTATISGTGAKKHWNAAAPAAQGYWAGFALPAPDGTTKVRYQFKAASADALTNDALKEIEPEANVTANGDSGIAFYYNIESDSQTSYAQVKWVGAKGVLRTLKFKVVIDVTLATPELNVASHDAEVLGKGISALQTNVAGVPDAANSKTIKVTGSTNYITDWAEYSSKEEEQSGNYVALKLTADPADATIKVTNPETTRTVTLDDGILVTRIENLGEDKILTVEVADGENKGAYTLDFSEVVTQNAPLVVKKVTMQAIGFEADRVDAYNAIHTLGSNAAQSNIADNTMYARFLGLDDTKQYKVEFTDAAGEVVYNSQNQAGDVTDHVITGTKTATVYFTFTGEGSVAVKPIANGEYSAVLYVKQDGEWVEIENVDYNETVTISSVDYELNGGVGVTPPAKTYYEVGKTVTVPTTDPTKTGYIFNGWKVGATVLTGTTYTTTAVDAVIKADWISDSIISAIVKDSEGTAEVAGLSADVAKTPNEDDKYVITLSGIVPEIEQGGSTYKLNYTLSSLVDETTHNTGNATFKLTKGADGTITAAFEPALTIGDYTYTLAIGDLVEATIQAGTPDVGDIPDTLPVEKQEVLEALTTFTTDDMTALVTYAAAQTDVQELIENSEVTVPMGYTLGVEVYLEITPVDCELEDETGNIANSYTLDITPKARLIVVKNGANDTEVVDNVDPITVSGFAADAGEKVTITAPLPANFVTEETKDDVYVEHQLTSGVETITPDTVELTSVTFKAKGFSLYTILVDSTSFDVIFTGAADPDKTLTRADVGTYLPYMTPPEGKNGFAGWATGENATSATWKYGPITVDMLKEMEAAAADKGGTLVLHPVFTTAPSSPIIHPGVSGGDNTNPTVTIGVTQPDNGVVVVTPKQAKAGEDVTVTVTPNEKYYVVTGVSAKGEKTTVTARKNADGTYTFTMPEGKSVTVSATISHIFDLFTDVPAGSFYVDPVKWAVEKGITLGNSTDYSTFGTTASCTRAQMVVFLYRAAGSPDVTGTTNSFTDLPADEEIRKAVQWAVDNGITQGTSETTFAPNDVCTRSQMVTFLYRYDEEPAVTGSNSFADVPADAFYKTAVQWAVNKGVTQGTNAAGTTFEPYTACSRGQMVTFLYRYMGE